MKLPIKKQSVLIIALLSILNYSCTEKGKGTETSTTVETNEIEIPIADEILLKDSTPTEVMLLGSWHFAYYNNDSHKTATEDIVDLSSDQRQKEIKAVVQRLKDFNPTIICVESQNQKRIDSIYNAYLKNEYQLEIDETEQLGFRVGKQLDLKKMYAVDVYGWLRDNYKQYPPLSRFWDKEHYLDTLTANKWNEKYSRWYSQNDAFVHKYTIDQCLMIQNHPNNIKRALGHYLVTLKTDNHNGPDAYALKWYSRNVRIFNNILKTNPKSEDRILVIYGSGHIPILEHLFDASPEFKIIRPYQY